MNLPGAGTICYVVTMSLSQPRAPQRHLVQNSHCHVSSCPEMSALAWIPPKVECEVSSEGVYSRSNVKAREEKQAGEAE